MSRSYEDYLSAIPPDMRAALSEFDRAANEIVDAFHAMLRAAPTPSILYHYTNDVGLRGILETGTLWLGDILSLNDASELSHGLLHANSILRGKATDGPPESRLFAANFEKQIRNEKVQRSGDHFICSFSSSGDNLGQWRAYADNGRGYALGFDSESLEDEFIRQVGAPILRTFPVTYNDARLLEIHRSIIEQMFGLISLPRDRVLAQDAINGYMALLSTLTTVHTLHAGVYFKHEAYDNEQEYRFMQVHPLGSQSLAAKLRTRSYSSIQYTEFNWKGAGRDVLREIAIGPSANFERAEAFAKASLLLTNQRAVAITRSAIPYRAT